MTRQDGVLCLDLADDVQHLKLNASNDLDKREQEIERLGREVYLLAVVKEPARARVERERSEPIRHTISASRRSGPPAGRAPTDAAF